MSDSDLQLAALFREARKMLRMSQEEMATLLGTDRINYGRWERGEVQPRMYHACITLRALCIKLLQHYTNSIGRLESRLDYLIDFLVSRRKKDTFPASKQENFAALEVFRYFGAAYQKRTGHRLTTTEGQGIKNARSLLKTHTPEVAKKVIDLFFTYDKRTRYSWLAFIDAFDNILPHTTGVVKQNAIPRATCSHCGRILDEGHAPDCPWLERKNA